MSLVTLSRFCSIILLAIHLLYPTVSGQWASGGATDGPLNFTYDRTDGRIVWITNRTSTNEQGQQIVQQVDYRRLLPPAGANGVTVELQQREQPWQRLNYDPGSPLWQKPDGICAEYELNVTTSDGRSHTQNLSAPPVVFKSSSKPRTSRMFFDPLRQRVMVELAWSNDFDHWTAVGAVLTDTQPWLKLISCQSVFRQVVPPPSLESVRPVLALWSFDPDYARHNCTFVFGLNGTLQMMQIPQSNARGSPQLITNGQLITLPLNTGPIVQQQQPRANIDPTCDRINFSTSLTNESLTFNLSCETVADSVAICIQPQRQCSLDCSPADIHAYNMQDVNNGEFLKIDWIFPDAIQRQAVRYQIRYAEANVTPWNTILGEKEPFENMTEPTRNYVEIRKFGNNENGGATNFTLQVCAELGQMCETAIQWEQERKYAIGYTPRPLVSANLIYQGETTTISNIRRKAKGAAGMPSKMSDLCLLLIGLMLIKFQL